MIEIIECPAAKAKPHAQYRLLEADRMAIIAASPAAIQAAEVERQRNAFIAVYGDPYGDLEA